MKFHILFFALAALAAAQLASNADHAPAARDNADNPLSKRHDVTELRAAMWLYHYCAGGVAHQAATELQALVMLMFCLAQFMQASRMAGNSLPDRDVRELFKKSSLEVLQGKALSRRKLSKRVEIPPAGRQCFDAVGTDIDVCLLAFGIDPTPCGDWWRCIGRVEHKFDRCDCLAESRYPGFDGNCTPIPSTCPPKAGWPSPSSGG